MDLQKFLDIIQRKATEIYPDLTDSNVAKAMYDDLKRWLPSLGINVSYNFTPARTTFICSPRASGAKIENSVENFANGLIFCVEDQRVKFLCIPAKDCKRLTSITNLPFKKEEYTMYYLVDGMSFTLYCDDGCWKYGTQHSIDVYDLTYRGVPYSEVFAKLNLDFEALDKTNCYHFRIKHRGLHPHNENTEFIYHLSTFSLTNMDFVDCDIGIQKQRSGTAITGKGFGYIFRAKSRDAPDYKYETPQRMKIVNMLYKPPFIKDRTELNKFMVYYARKNFYILHNYLRPTMRTEFIKTFPQFEDEYRKYDDFLDKIANLFFGGKPEDDRSQQFYTNIKDDILHEYHPKSKQDLIKNYLHNPKYAYAIYECVYA